MERANGYLEGSVLPGRTFTSPADFNDQLAVWLGKAKTRLVRSTAARPAELLATDRAAMLGLPPVAPVTEFHARVRLPRDYYVRVVSNDYSVDPQASDNGQTLPSDPFWVPTGHGMRVIHEA
ncbi:hypothetical protein AAFM46_11950 [Arthrobacter sp. TMP15]|uniref:Mu transposase domain-containing protein n=1 Tax=Arthrobacter sp. TMP15 TaxID=3140789 RepID=UPI0031B9F380